MNEVGLFAVGFLLYMINAMAIAGLIADRNDPETRVHIVSVNMFWTLLTVLLIVFFLLLVLVVNLSQNVP